MLTTVDTLRISIAALMIRLYASVMQLILYLIGLEHKWAYFDLTYTDEANYCLVKSNFKFFKESLIHTMKVYRHLHVAYHQYQW